MGFARGGPSNAMPFESMDAARGALRMDRGVAELAALASTTRVHRPVSEDERRVSSTGRHRDDRERVSGRWDTAEDDSLEARVALGRSPRNGARRRRRAWRWRRGAWRWGRHLALPSRRAAPESEPSHR